MSELGRFECNAIPRQTSPLTRGFWIMQRRHQRFEVSIIEKGLVNDQKMPTS